MNWLKISFTVWYDGWWHLKSMKYAKELWRRWRNSRCRRIKFYRWWISRRSCRRWKLDKFISRISKLICRSDTASESGHYDEDRRCFSWFSWLEWDKIWETDSVITQFAWVLKTNFEAVESIQHTRTTLSRSKLGRLESWYFRVDRDIKTRKTYCSRTRTWRRVTESMRDITE